nr:hypothetical protein [Tanacetum cinerariifolium]
MIVIRDHIKKANQQSKDFENQNKDLQDKYDVLKNQATTFEMNNKELNEELKELIEKNNDFLAQTKKQRVPWRCNTTRVVFAAMVHVESIVGDEDIIAFRVKSTRVLAWRGKRKEIYVLFAGLNELDWASLSFGATVTCGVVAEKRMEKT